MEQLKSGSNNPLMMPGPKFDETGWWAKIKNFLKQNSQSIALLVIGVAIITGGIYLYSNYQKSNLALNPEEVALEEEQQGIVKPEQINIGENRENQSPAEKGQVTTNGSSGITVKAGKGAGVTHLGRAALKQYLVSNSDMAKGLTSEHKIYIEDYLKDKTSSAPLAIGQEMTFSNDLIKQAIDSSNDLTQKQLDNLHKYTLLVPSL
ncbi:MAG: hypothetical protein PHQ47_00340 [Candidatus Portnoybacteria bacterium]|nr:hypothetical protein [Candidatus Portnoybacteria bacterium]